MESRYFSVMRGENSKASYYKQFTWTYTYNKLQNVHVKTQSTSNGGKCGTVFLKSGTVQQKV